MRTSSPQTFLFSEEELISSQPGSPASHSAMLASEKEQRTNATSHRQRSAPLASADPLGWFWKMFRASYLFTIRPSKWDTKHIAFLSSMETRRTWSTPTPPSRKKRSVLLSQASKTSDIRSPRWELGTRRLEVCRLRLSEHHTSETEYGLLHTPAAQEAGITVDRLVTKNGEPAKIGERAYDKETGRLAQVGLEQQVQMLPTPQAIDAQGTGRPLRLKKDMDRNPETPGSWRGDLKDHAVNDLLPTPKVGGDEGYATRKARQGHAKAVSYLEANVEYRMTNGWLPTPQSTEAPHTPKEGWKWRGSYWRDENGKKVQAGLASDPRLNHLLPTPSANRDPKPGWTWNGIYWKDENGRKVQTDLNHAAKLGLLPTPTTSEGGQNATAPTVTNGNAKGKKHGKNLQGAVNDMLPTPRSCATGHITPERANDANPNLEVILAKMMIGGQLPTPTDQDCKNDSLPISQQDRNDSIPKRIIQAMDGQTGQMRPSPFFVEEMMGFPPCWTLAPFLTAPLEIDTTTVPDWENFPQNHTVIGPADLDHVPWDRKKLRLSPKATAEQCATRFRKISIKGYGNAIVCQNGLAIAQAINAVEDMLWNEANQIAA